MSKREHLYNETKKDLRKQIIETIKKRKWGRKPLKEQMGGGATLFGTQGCQMCPVGQDLLQYGSNWNNLIFTSGQNAGQVTCQQSNNPSGGGPDYCPNWGIPTPFNDWGEPEESDFPNTDNSGITWGCPYAFSTFGGDCETPIAGGYMCPIELFPGCCHSYTNGDHQYPQVLGPHPTAQDYMDYCKDWAPGEEEGVSDQLICYTCKNGNVVGQKFAPGSNKNYPGLSQSGNPIAACPPGWFETQEEAQASCGDATDSGRLMGKNKKMDPPPTLPMDRPRGRMNEQVKRMKKLAGIKKKK